jgi:hypothetical protein
MLRKPHLRPPDIGRQVAVLVLLALPAYRSVQGPTGHFGGLFLPLFGLAGSAQAMGDQGCQLC